MRKSNTFAEFRQEDKGKEKATPIIIEVPHDVGQAKYVKSGRCPGKRKNIPFKSNDIFVPICMAEKTQIGSKSIIDHLRGSFEA